MSSDVTGGAPTCSAGNKLSDDTNGLAAMPEKLKKWKYDMTSIGV